VLTELARAYYGPGVNLRVEAPAAEVRKTRAELKEMALTDPVVRQAQEKFQARIVEVRPPINGTAQENEI
jgi:DNA polymerase-3 subunit gamma/tau